MATELPSGDGTNVTPSRYSESRAPQFTGGDVDPSTGNVVPATKAGITSGSDAAAADAAAAAAPAVSMPTTQLGNMDAGPSKSAALVSGLESGLGSAAISLGAKALGNTFGSNSTNKTDSASTPNAGGFSSGGGTGNGGGAPLNLSPGVSNSPSGSSAGLDNTTLSGGSSLASSGGSEPAIPSGYDPGASVPPASAVSAPAPSAPPPSGGEGGGGEGGGGDAGSVICTELHRQGLLIGDTFDADQRFGAMVMLHHPDVYAGYLVWARHVVSLMKRSKRFTGFVCWAAAPWADYMAIRMGRNGFPTIRGFVTYHVGWAVCAAVGKVMATLAPRLARHA